MADTAEIKGAAVFATAQSESSNADRPVALVSGKTLTAGAGSPTAFQSIKPLMANIEVTGAWVSMKGTDSSVSRAHLVVSVAEGGQLDFKLSADTDRSLQAQAAIMSDTELRTANSAEAIADTERGLYVGIDSYGDTERIATRKIEKSPFSINADSLLSIVTEEDIELDTERVVCKRSAVSINGDTARSVKLQGNMKLLADSARKIQQEFSLFADTCTGLFFEITADTARRMNRGFRLFADTCRRTPFDTTFSIPANKDEQADPFLMPRAVQSDGMVSMAITLNELSLSDSFELETTLPVDIMDAVRGTILDFQYRYVISETTWSGRTTTASGMYDEDSVLYTPMIYSDGSYKRKASAHAGSIASALGRNLNISIDDFTHSSTWVGNGQTYASIISSLFGWTSSIPHRQINVFLRAADNSLNIIQRGYESKVTDITDTHHTRPEYHREIMRTMWSGARDSGSKEASGINIEPTPFSGTITFGDAVCSYASGYLVSETAHGETTTYSYTGSADAGMYLGSKRTVHSDGGITTTVYSYSGTVSGARILGEETETTIDNKGRESSVRKTIHAPLGNGFYGTSVYVDGEYQGSAISTGSPASAASRYMRNEESITMGGASYGGGSSSGYSLLDEASFPIEEKSILQNLTNEIKWLNRKIKETVTMDIYNYGHVLDFTERIAFRGNEYYLASNRISRTVRELKQSITMARWY